MYHVGRDELEHARWKSRRLFAVVSLYFGVGETKCSQGKRYKDSFYKFATFTCPRSSTVPRFFYSAFFKYPFYKSSFYKFVFSIGPRFKRLCFTSLVHSFSVHSSPIQLFQSSHNDVTSLLLPPKEIYFRLIRFATCIRS